MTNFMTDDHEFGIQEHCRTKSDVYGSIGLESDKDETNIDYSRKME